MNNIVLYRTTFSIGLLVLAFSLSAQKPVIDLIPSSNQIRGSEVIVDTSFVLDSMVHLNKYDHPASFRQDNESRKSLKQERRQIGPSVDSLFGKPVARKADLTRPAGNLSLYIRKFNPLKFFISIFALK